MKRNNKKGFTIVELVIVIAVIGILAGVLIPTFSSIIEKANESDAIQVGRGYYMEIYAEDLSDGVVDNKVNNDTLDVKDVVTLPDGESCTWDGTKFTYNNGKYTATFEDGVWSAKKN